MSKSTLRQFVNLISEAVDVIEDAYASAGVQFPSLDASFDPNQTSSALLFRPDIAKQAAIIVCAAEELSISVRPSQAVLLETGLGYHKSTALGAVSSGCVPEILREAGPQGLHVSDISAKNGIDPSKLSRLLRLLASHSIFVEVEPDVFANNRISSVLDTMTPTSALFSDDSPTSHDPTNPWFNKFDKYTGSNGTAAFIEHSTEEGLKASSYLTQHLFSEDTRLSEGSTETPLNRAFNMKFNLFGWLYGPGNEQRGNRFGWAMKGLEEPQSILADGGFPWESLPAGSKVVDVGGGIGFVSLTVAKKYSHLNFVIQDLEMVESQATAYWEENLPGSAGSGLVSFQAHDFFQPQPVKDADLWFLRVVIHDWANSSAVKILKNLKEASVRGKTKLLIVDAVVDYACEGTPSDAKMIEGATHQQAPRPLLPNFGRAHSMTYFVDIQMMSLLNGHERTIGGHLTVLKEAGWKITRIYRPALSLHQHILAELA